jgi:hypothetical protein
MIGEFVADSRCLCCRVMETLLLGRSYWPACTVGPKTTDTAWARNNGLRQDGAAWQYATAPFSGKVKSLFGYVIGCRLRPIGVTPVQYIHREAAPNLPDDALPFARSSSFEVPVTRND